MFAAAVASLALLAPPTTPPTAAAKAGPMIGHMVYFTLKDRTPAAREKLAASCAKYLEDLDGVVFFAAGTLPEDGFAAPLNDREWDVALQIVFASKAAHDAYDKHEKHLAFIDENKAAWAKVRVFDSVFAAGKKTGKADAAPAQRERP